MKPTPPVVVSITARYIIFAPFHVKARLTKSPKNTQEQHPNQPEKTMSTRKTLKNLLLFTLKILYITLNLP
jgi:hypothetical protein